MLFAALWRIILEMFAGTNDGIDCNTTLGPYDSWPDAYLYDEQETYAYK